MLQQPQSLLAQGGKENFVCLLEHNARLFGTKPAMVWDGGEISWAEMDQRASGFAQSLAQQGVGAGDRIATLLPNHWTFAVTLLGILKLGGTAATLHPTLKPEELADVMADLQPQMLVKNVTADKGVWNTPRFSASPALIVYTSGSTGRPKGSVFGHDAFTFANRA